jgi:hypothetical protein
VPQQLMKLCIKSSTCQHQLLPRLNAHGRIQQDLETARTELRAVRKDLKDSQKKEAHAVREALLSKEAERDVSLAMCALRLAGQTCHAREWRRPCACPCSSTQVATRQHALHQALSKWPTDQQCSVVCLPLSVPSASQL